MSDTDTDIDPGAEPFISARRQSAKIHLREAASAPVASNAERYHLAAAVAESLERIERHLATIARALASSATDPAGPREEVATP